MTSPQLDHYIGQTVEAVETFGGGDWDWGIRLVGHAIVRNEDKRRTHAPENIENKTFLNFTLSETGTTMNFGHYDNQQFQIIDESVDLTPTQYSITDQRFEEGEPYYPQRPDVEEQEALPEDPSEERVVDGPEQPFSLPPIEGRSELALDGTETPAEATEE